MAGIPIIHLGSNRPPSPRPLPSIDLSITPDTTSHPLTLPLTPPPTPAAPVRRYKSILKKMAIPITWGDVPTPPAPIVTAQPGKHSKLSKKPPKNVHFTSPPSAQIDMGGSGDVSYPVDGSFSYKSVGLALADGPALVGPIDGLPTPPNDPPFGSEKKQKKKGGGLAKLLGPKSATKHPHGAVPMPPLTDLPLSPPLDSVLAGPSSSATPDGTLGASDDGGTESWHHHASYFPEYEPIHPSASSIPGLPGVHGHATYYPAYEPIFHPSHPIHAYPGASGALAYALSTPEAEAAKHAARVGHSVSIHYPDLPRFAEYQSAGGALGWQGNKWGVEGWTGYGWQGEKLPSGEEGLTFGAPMPKGVAVPTEEELKKQKEKEKKAQKDKEAGEGGADGDDAAGGDDAMEGGEGGEGQGGAGGAQGGGGGGGKKSKKKKKGGG